MYRRIIKLVNDFTRENPDSVGLVNAYNILYSIMIGNIVDPYYEPIRKEIEDLISIKDKIREETELFIDNQLNYELILTLKADMVDYIDTKDKVKDLDIDFNTMKSEVILKLQSTFDKMKSEKVDEIMPYFDEWVIEAKDILSKYIDTIYNSKELIVLAKLTRCSGKDFISFSSNLNKE